jgi:small conductance mechanosensitive channel
MDIDIEKVLSNYVYPWSLKIALALIIFLVGRLAAKLLKRTLRKIMEKARLDEMLISFINSIIYTVLLVIVAMAALEQLGVNTTSALAILGAAGLAVGLALKDSLSNFASGVMLIIFRPFKVGDFIDAAGVNGVVEKILIVSTVMRTVDNREIIVPNSKIYSDKIINFSARDTRRIDLVMGISYDDDIDKARQLMLDVMSADERILKDPAPVVAVSELADSSINFFVWPWVKSGDYLNVRSDLLESFKKAFDEKGISIPYPQREVHLHEVSAS